MNSLDYTTIKVVGVVEPHTNGIHAYPLVELKS